MAKPNDPGQTFEGFLEEAPTSHSKRPSPAKSSISNMMQGNSLKYAISGASDFLKDSGMVRREDDVDIMAASDDEAEVLTKLKKELGTMRPGSVVRHAKNRDRIFVILQTKVDIAASGKPRHLVVEKDTGTKFKIAENLLKPL